MIEIANILCPYPHLDENGALVDGLTYSSAPICHKCKTRDCASTLDWSDSPFPEHRTCPSGVSVVRLAFDDGDLICTGFLASGKNTSCTPQLRKALREHKIHWDEIERWHCSIANAFPMVQDLAEEKAKQLTHSLHDVKAAVNTVTRNAEGLLGEVAGATEEEREDNAPPLLRSLVESVRLLHARLQMTAMVNNPLAAAHGRRHPTPVYRLFHRMAHIFERVAARKTVFLRMNGNSTNRPSCYDSLDYLALVLIDNAVKYSNKGKEIRVIVDDLYPKPGAVGVRVESYGPVLKDNEIARMFERGFRGEYAIAESSQGFGLGLTIAKTIADAHGFELFYEKQPSSRNDSIGNNIFRFTVG
jgi:K+-sensing histidine kinase KdpD